MRVYKRIRCQVCVCVNIPCCSLLPPHISPPPRLSLPMHHLACELMLLSSEGVLCVCGFAQLVRLFPSCSIALAAAAAERLSCPRILFCTFYPKSVQEHCPFSLTVNIVTALTNKKGSGAMSGLKHTIWQFWGIFQGSASLSLSAFRPKTFTFLSCCIMSGWVKME